MASMVEKLPGMGKMADALQDNAHQKQMIQMEAIIDSMTIKERRKPELINGSRKKRIAAGSGTQIQDINRLMKQHKQMQKMIKKMKQKGGMANMMRGLGGMTQGGGGFPPM
jgi:signal recognition particle subunit SRP54